MSLIAWPGREENGKPKTPESECKSKTSCKEKREADTGRTETKSENRPLRMCVELDRANAPVLQLNGIVAVANTEQFLC